jgi:hypothetical protein
MAEHSPVLAPPGSNRQDIYRPLSKLAFAAIFVAGSYSVLVVVFAAVAVATGWPLFLNLWNLIFPVTGVVLAYAGRQHIRNSEGILSGLALTTWAWWLSILFGLGYGAYYFGTYTAVSWQAEDYLTRWFDRIRAGKINEAFLDTQEPAKRKFDNPSDSDFMYQRYGMNIGQRKGFLSVFQDLELVRLLQNAGPDVEVKLLGVKNWEFDKGGYQVTETYRITTPEGDFNSSLLVKSSESKEIEGRQWQVDLQTLHFAERPRLSPLGQALDRWRQQSRRFAADWLIKRSHGDLLGAFLDTRPLSERTSLQRGFLDRTALAGLRAGVSIAGAGVDFALLEMYALFRADGQVRCALYLPGYWDYCTGQLVRADGFVSVKSVRTDIVRNVKRYFQDPAHLVLQRVGEGRGRFVILNKDQGPVQFFHDVPLAVHLKGSSAAPDFHCEAALIVESDPGPLSVDRYPNWRIVGLELIRGGKPAVDPTRAGPNASGAPPLN